MGLISYLRSARQAISTLSSSKEKVHVVIGNEACDLDSAVCALVMGYLLATRLDNRSVIPVLNVARSDYRLKTEVKFVFEKAGITDDTLVFFEDLDFTALHREHLLEITLVDHNVVSRLLRPFQDAVVQVIDHHEWQGIFSQNIDRIVEPVGSCCTLVGHRLLAHGSHLLDPLVAQLLSCAIITDTSNFHKTLKKSTPMDIEVFRNLNQHLPEIQWNKEYENIQKAKQSVTSLTVCDVLRKDLKLVETDDQRLIIAVPTVPITQRSLVQMPNFLEELEIFRKMQSADAVVALTAADKPQLVSKQDFSHEGIHRGIIVYVPNVKLFEAILAFLHKYDKPLLEIVDVPPKTYHELGGVDTCQATSLCFLNIQNAAVSRKVVLPALKRFAEVYK